VIAAIYALIVWTLDWRFMIVIVPICAAAIAIALERLIPQRAAALAFIAPGFVWGLLLIFARYGPIPHTPAQCDAFVASKIGVYHAVRSLGPQTVYVLAAPNMAYYCPGKCLGDYIGPYRLALVEPLLNDPPRLADQLRRFGVTHLVIDRSITRFAGGAPFRLVYSDEKASAYEIR
jgi:hypothetical protein